jgi:hypothetical protein
MNRNLPNKTLYHQLHSRKPAGFRSKKGKQHLQDDRSTLVVRDGFRVPVDWSQKQVNGNRPTDFRSPVSRGSCMARPASACVSASCTALLASACMPLASAPPSAKHPGGVHVLVSFFYKKNLCHFDREKVPAGAGAASVAAAPAGRSRV